MLRYFNFILLFLLCIFISYSAPLAEDIIFESDFSDDVGYYISNFETGPSTVVPSGWDRVKATGSESSISVIANEGVGGVKPAARLLWDSEGSNSAQPTVSLMKHLTGDQNTGYDDIYVRYHVRLPDEFRVGDRSDVFSEVAHWKWGRLWQNTPTSDGAHSENRDDSYYIVWNWNTRPLYGTRMALTFGENIGPGREGGSNSGPRTGPSVYHSGGSADGYHVGFPLHWDSVANGAWEVDHLTREFFNKSQAWHTIEWRFKLSSCDTCNDGFWQVWFDGEEQILELPFDDGNTDQAIDQASHPHSLITAAKPGFNYITVFDNLRYWNRNWADAGADGGIWVNDVVVSTTRIGHDYVVGQNTVCSVDADCNPDGLFCNGEEVCQNSVCTRINVPVCNDGISCTNDFCNEAIDSCDVVLDHDFCDDGNLCTSNTCSASLGCQLSNNDGVSYDDGISCTQNDICQDGSCQAGTPDDSICLISFPSCSSATCNPGVGCENYQPLSCNIPNLADDLIHSYNFDENEGSVTYDYTGSFNGSLSGSVNFVPGYSESALDFSGGYVDLGNLDLNTNELTIAAWINPDTLSGDDPRIISKAIGTSQVDHFWMLSTAIQDSEYRLRGRLRTDQATAQLVASSGEIQTNTWQHVAMTYDGSIMKLFLNGLEVASGDGGGVSGTVATDSSAGSAIGINPVGSRAFDGQIDEVRIYDRALSSSEISDDMSTKFQFTIDQPNEGNQTNQTDSNNHTVNNFPKLENYFSSVCGPLPAPPQSDTIITVNPAQASQLRDIILGASSGTTIYLEDGFYDLSSNLRLEFPTSDITLRSLSGNRSAVVLDGGYSSSGPATIVYVDQDDITIADITIQHSYYHPFHVVGPSVNTLIHNVRIIDGGEQFIKANPNSGNFADYGKIECSYFEMTDEGSNNVRNNCYTGGIDVHSGQSWEVRNNVFNNIYCRDGSGIAEHAIHFWSQARDTLVEKNLIVNGARGIGFGLSSTPSTVPRTYSDDPLAGTGITPTEIQHIGGVIRNNIIYGDIGNFIDTGIGLERAYDAEVYHNTVYLGDNIAFAPIDARFSSTLAVFRNNLYYPNYFSQRNSPIVTESNNMVANLAMFEDYTNFDFNLVDGSSAIDAGFNSGVSEDFDGSLRPQGLGYDIGAHEYSSTQTIDLTSPEITIISPSEGYEFDSTTSNVSLSLNTDELASCLMSTSSDLSNPSSLDSADSLSHEIVINVDSNMNYTYYIECRDLSLNPALTNISFSVSAPLDTTAPVLSLGVPQNQNYVDNSTQIILSLTTDESSTCKYVEDQGGLSYGSLPNTFTITGLTTHTTNLGYLENNQTYNYYVKCEDLFGNSNTDDYILNFTLGEISNTSEQEETPIEILSFSPNNVVFAETVQNVSLFVETNENSLCYYNSNSYDTYSDLASFGGLELGTYGTNHTQTLSSLALNTQYTYYVACEGDNFATLSFSLGKVSTPEEEEEDDSSSGGGSSGGGSSGGGSSSSSSSSSSFLRNVFSDDVCVSELSEGDWSSCLNGLQKRTIVDVNGCQDDIFESRVCSVGNSELENKFLNAKSIEVSQSGNRLYLSDLKGSYNEIVFTQAKLDDESFVLVDEESGEEYLGRLVEESDDKFYYSLERIDQSLLETLKEEGLISTSIGEDLGNLADSTYNHKSFWVVVGVISFMIILTLAFGIRFYVKKQHRESSFDTK